VQPRLPRTPFTRRADELLGLGTGERRFPGRSSSVMALP
jgi:hypothetical protein